MQILTLGNELLRQKALPVKEIGGEYIEIANSLFEAIRMGRGIGLAGPQIGLMERIFAVEIEDGERQIFINPSIIETSQDTVRFEEGCLSIPGVYADVVRPRAIKVQAWDERGRPFTIEASGLAARVILHEYDHLEGILFIDRLPDEKRDKILAKIEKTSLKEKAAG